MFAFCFMTPFVVVGIFLLLLAFNWIDVETEGGEFPLIIFSIVWNVIVALFIFGMIKSYRTQKRSTSSSPSPQNLNSTNAISSKYTPSDLDTRTKRLADRKMEYHFSNANNPLTYDSQRKNSHQPEDHTSGSSYPRSDLGPNARTQAPPQSFKTLLIRYLINLGIFLVVYYAFANPVIQQQNGLIAAIRFDPSSFIFPGLLLVSLIISLPNLIKASRKANELQ